MGVLHFRYTLRGFCRLWFALTGFDLAARVQRLHRPDDCAMCQDEELDFLISISDGFGPFPEYQAHVEAIRIESYHDDDYYVRWDLGTYELPASDYSTFQSKYGTPFPDEQEAYYYLEGERLSLDERPFGAYEKVDQQVLYLLMGLGKLRQGNINISQFVGSLRNYGFECDKVKLIQDSITGEALFCELSVEGNQTVSVRSVLKHINEFISLVRQ